jgi:hypothetical protein
MCNTTSNLDDAAPVQDEPVMIERADYSSTIEDEDEDEEEDEEEESVEDEDEDEEGEESVEVEGMGKLAKVLFRSDFVKVSAALDVLIVNLGKDTEQCETFIFWGGCAAVVELVQHCLKKAMKKIPACGRVTELDELAELTTLHKSLRVITTLTYTDDVSRVGISTVGGVEAVVEVMKTFPKCQALQEYACCVLRNLAFCDSGKQKANEADEIEVLLAAVNNHLDSAFVSRAVCLALADIVTGSKENTVLLISLGGAAAVAKIRTKWPEDEQVQTPVRSLTELLVGEMKTWI